MTSPFSKIKRNGFTLIETLVAVSLITVAMAGPFMAAERAFFAAANSKNRLTASYLAQEGIEYVRMLRDNTYLIDYQNNNVGAYGLSTTAFYDDFLNGVSGAATSIRDCADGVQGGGGTIACALDQSLLSIGIGSGKNLQVCPSLTTCPSLYLHSDGKYKFAVSGTPLFTRSIRFYGLNASELEVVVTVSWSYHGVISSVALATYLSPWE